MKEQSSSHPLIRWWNACLVASHSFPGVSHVQLVTELILQASEDSDDVVALEACDSGLRSVNMAAYELERPRARSNLHQATLSSRGGMPVIPRSLSC